jgi:hypothetical protein
MTTTLIRTIRTVLAIALASTVLPIVMHGGAPPPAEAANTHPAAIAYRKVDATPACGGVSSSRRASGARGAGGVFYS